MTTSSYQKLVEATIQSLLHFIFYKKMPLFKAYLRIYMFMKLYVL